MPRITVQTFDQWRYQARLLLEDETPPRNVSFESAFDNQLMLNLEPRDEPIPERRISKSLIAAHVPRQFIELARKVACHRDPRRWDLMYHALWRITHGEHDLLEIATDDDVLRLRRMESAVARDAHKAQAFVRFRRIEDGAGAQFVAWHRPDHFILRLVAPFFARRFPQMSWAILTPDESVRWDTHQLRYGEGVPASAAPRGDELEHLWRTCYRSIFNPARIKLQAMKREMPVRHWRTLPDTQAIPDLLAEAPRRVDAMIRFSAGKRRSAADFLPDERDLESLRFAARSCEGCDLCHRATQTVFGRGLANARLMLVGEQPGDQEDLAGEPFVGPAGRVLDEAFAACGLSRNDVYLTNAVKHFHWEPQGKRRLHAKPPARALAACRPWLEAELAQIKPRVLICLGVTAAQAIVGRDTRQMRRRGEFLHTRYCDRTLITWHPATILRADRLDSERLRRELVDHLRLAQKTANAAQPS